MSEEWIDLVARRESPLWVSLVCLGGRSRWFEAALGWSYEIENYQYSDHTHRISVGDALRLREIISSEAAKGDFFKTYLDRCKEASARLETTTDSVAGQFSMLRKGGTNGDQLATCFSRFADSVQGAIPFLASLVIVQDILESELRTRLSNTLGTEPTSDSVGRLLSQCVVASANTNVVRESRSLLDIAAKLEAAGVAASELSPQPVTSELYERRPALRALIDSHLHEFGWLRTFTYLGEPFSEREILERAAIQLETGDVARRHAETEARSRLAREKARRTIREHSLPEPTCRLIELASEYLMWRFERIDIHFKCEVRLRMLQKHIAENLGLTRDELVLLTYDEVMAALANEAIPPAEQLHRRRDHGFTCSVSNGAFTIEAAAPLPSVEDPDIHLPLSGTTACAGQATGPARLVLSSADMGRVNRGDILVATMTTPDLMLAIEKCSAIVTDEGGLLCHAAIISRELQTPCVIGTSCATKAIKDGDCVTVVATIPTGQVQAAEPAWRSAS